MGPIGLECFQFVLLISSSRGSMWRPKAAILLLACLLIFCIWRCIWAFDWFTSLKLALIDCSSSLARFWAWNLSSRSLSRAGRSSCSLLNISSALARRWRRRLRSSCCSGSLRRSCSSIFLSSRSSVLFSEIIFSSISATELCERIKGCLYPQIRETDLHWPELFASLLRPGFGLPDSQSKWFRRFIKILEITFCLQDRIIYLGQLFLRHTY